MIARLVSSVPVFAALVALALPCQAQGVAVGSSSLIGSLHYSDSFTIGAGATVPSRVTYAAQSFPLPSTVAWVENGHGNGVTSWGTSNFSIATDAAVSATTDSPYPGSSGAGSATGFTQSGVGVAGLDWSIPYGLSNDFVVQFDAVQMKGRVGVTIGPTGGNIEATGNISIFFRRNSSSLAQIGIYKNGIGETNTGLTSGISSAGQWHNYAVRVNIPNQTIEVFVNQTSRGVINLATLGGGAYQLVSNTSVGFGGAGNDRIWTDNFQIGIPAAAPTVTGVTPASGPLTGGTSVTITGTKFTGATGVTFGGAAATGVTVINDTTITCTIPPGTLGPASVVVTTPNGTIAANTLFSYSNAAISATSALIGTQHYSDSFTIGSGAPVTARITYAGTFPLSNAVATVENTYGNAAQSWGTSNFSIAKDAAVSATTDSPYPGSSGAGSATGFTQSGISSSASLDWSIPYGLSNDFVVQFDAVQMKGRVGVSFGNSIGIAGTGNLSIFFRTAGSSSPQIGIFNSSLGELNTGLTSGIAVAGQWNNYAVRVNIPDKTVEVFVNQVSRGVINLATLNGGAYQNLMNNAFVGVGGSGNDRIWTDNFLVGTSNVSPLAPTVTTVAPASGPPAGGTSTTITGTNFTGTTAVRFGGIAAASFTVVNATTITAITAARTEGTVDVSVTNPFGTGIGRGLFTYGTPPTISHVLPPSGGTGGGTRVTLVGTGFTGATGVTLGGFPATSVNVINDNMLTAITGAGGSGLVNVVVSRPNGTGSGVGLYTYGLAAPVAGNAWLPRLSAPLNWLSAACSADGSLQFAGAENYNFWRSFDFGVTWGTTQTIKNWKALACSANGAKLIAAATAPGEILTSSDSGWTWTVRESSRNWVSVASSADGNKLAAVVNGGQIFTSTDSGLTWAAREGSRNWCSISSSADGSRLVASVAGGQIYTSTDSGVTWAARDNNRNWSAVASSASGDWLTATSRGEFGTGSVYFSSDAGVTWAGLVTFTTPISLAMSADGRRVVVGSANGQIHRTATLNSGGWISAGPTNTWNAVAMSADGGRMLAGGLASEIHTSYGALPLASSVSPTFGPTSGGTACQLFGENLSPGGPVSVTVGGVPATVTFTSPFFIGFTTNARTAGTVDIVVTTANGSVTRSAAFTYGEPPSIGAVLPPNGSPAGGTNVTIVGANFTGVTSVTLGDTPLTSFTILSGSTLSFVTPPRTAGAVDVVVTNPFGTATRAGGFTYAPQAVPAGFSWTAQGPTLNWTSITSSADGTRLAAIGTDLFNISSSIYTSADSGVTWVARDTQRAWREIASSADGSKLVATVAGGFIYTSGDFGVTWTARSTSRNWDQITSSADGTRLAATGGGTSLAVSTDSGVTWALQATTGYSWNDITLTGDGNRLLGVASAGPLVSTNLGQSWSNLSPNLSPNGLNGITASADGTKLAATGIAGFIYTSTNSGTTWTQRESERSWRGITSSANGAVIAAVSYNGFIYVSTDAGVTWNQSASSRNWRAITSSADGSLLAAVAADSTIWISRGGFVPEISSITPSSGGTAGGTMVTISGAYLTGTTAVSIGGVAATNITVQNSATLTATTGARTAGLVDVTLTTLSGTATLANGFTYINSPSVANISPAAGSTLGGTTVTLTGANFFGITGVSIGGVACTGVNVVNSTTLTAVTGAKAPGPASAIVTSVNGTGTGAGLFTYISPPVVTSIASATGSTAGGTLVTITGANFTGTTAVSIGGVAATAVTVLNDSTLTAVTGARAAGVVNVAVATPYGSGTGTGLFTYGASPAITAILPPNGSIFGGTQVTIVGANLTGITGVTIGGVAATGVTVINDSTVNAITGARSAGVADVIVTSSFGSGTGSGLFTYGLQTLPAGNTWIARGPVANWQAACASASGNTMAAVVNGGQIYISTDSGVTWTPRASNRAWTGITCSADGTKMAAAVSNGFLYTSTDSGITWTQRATTGFWGSIASSADGVRLAAINYGGNLYTSSDSGVTWTARSSVRNWIGIACSADGRKLVATEHQGGGIYTSGDFGATWTLRTSGQTWILPASSADGNKLIVATYNGQLRTSEDSGVTWTLRESSRNWGSTSSSSDGNILGAVGTGTPIFTSLNSGVAWTAKDSVRSWSSIASSADGSKMVALSQGGQIYTSVGLAPISVTGISPSGGSTAGGTSVTLTGTGFTGATAVTIGGAPATNVSVVNDTTLTATTPAGIAGPASVIVTSPSGENPPNALFTYFTPPVVTAISPSSGISAGGTSVTITGTSFTGTTAVTIGGSAATSVNVVDATTITAITPPGVVGTASVLVTHPGGTSAANTPYTYLTNSLNANLTAASTIPLTFANPSVTGISLNISLSHAPVLGTPLMLLKNTGLDFIRGTFSNLAQGQAVTLSYGGNTYNLVANYFGGSGNDLVLVWAGTHPVAWGYNSDGGLGNGNTMDSSLPVAVDDNGVLAGKTVISVTGGKLHGLAVCSDGTLASWGANWSGQLGVGNYTASSVPLAVPRTGALAGKTVVAASSGGEHSLVLCSDGSLVNWGNNSAGQLGIGNTTGSSLPVAVPPTGALAGKTVVAITAGTYHSVVLCSDGTLVAWGENGDGQLGIGSYTSSSVPMAVSRTGVLAGKTVIAVSAPPDWNWTMALCSDGTLASWGYNGYGNLGVGDATYRNVPALVSGNGVLAGKTVVDFAIGGVHGLALCTDGTLVTWGYSRYGEFGISGLQYEYLPIAVPIRGALSGKTFVALGAGDSFSLVACSDGTLAAFGANSVGELGNGSTTNSDLPVAVSTSGLRPGERLIPTSLGRSYWFTTALVAPAQQPFISEIAPSTGPTAGGTPVTITGSGFTGASSVTIGGTPATSVTVVNATSITAITPAGTTGSASVLITGPSGSNEANTLFQYFAPSTVTAVSPSSGPTAGGDSVTITGTGFTGATSVTIGGLAATNVTVVNSTTITATTPAGSAGTASVLVTTPGGTNAANSLFTYTNLAGIESWRQTWYGTTANTGNAADTSDPYKTGVSNLLAFAFFGPNQDPALANISLLPKPVLSGGNYTATFTQPSGVSGITYGAEWSTTLANGNWTAIPNTGSGSQHTFTAPVGTNGKFFMRLKVTNP